MSSASHEPSIAALYANLRNIKAADSASNADFEADLGTKPAALESYALDSTLIRCAKAVGERTARDACAELSEDKKRAIEQLNGYKAQQERKAQENKDYHDRILPYNGRYRITLEDFVDHISGYFQADEEIRIYQEKLREYGAPEQYIAIRRSQTEKPVVKVDRTGSSRRKFTF